MKHNFILIHGAWHGSWCWVKVAALLKERGYQVITPDLPGHTRDCTFMPLKQINLTTYIHFLSALVASQKNPVFLVGHSLAAGVITQVAQMFPEKIAELIYIAGLLPSHSRSCVQEAVKQPSKEASQLMRANHAKNEMLLCLEETEKIKEVFYHQSTPQEFKQALHNLQREPLQPMLAQHHIQSCFKSIKKSYIICSQDKAVEVNNQFRMAQKAKINNIIFLESDHTPFWSHPVALTDILSLRALHRYRNN